MVGVKLRKPILLTGVGVSMVLWTWQSLHFHLAQVGEWGMLGAMALGAGAWLLQPKSRLGLATPLKPLTPEALEQSLEQATARLNQLQIEAPQLDLSAYQKTLGELPQELNRSTLRVAITGRRKVGKTSLSNLLSLDNLEFSETLPLLTEKTPELEAEIVLFLVDSDLTDSEWQILQAYYHSYHRLLLLFNKQDQYPEEERELILGQLRERVKSLLPGEEVIAIATAPNPIKVRQHQADGEVKEWLEATNPDLGNLQGQLKQLLEQEKEQLLRGTIWRRARQISQQGQEQLNQMRRERALPVVENYQWLSAATAFANPVPAIDLVATAAINGQMILDLGEIYQQKLSLSQAQTLASILGKLMLQLGLVEFSSQAIASLLKSHFITYVAGGTVQGISAAYLTRLAGLSLIEYFQEEITLPDGNSENWAGLRDKLQQVFGQNQRLDWLQNFIQQVLSKNTIPVTSP